ncbi:DUF1861 family protein [Anaerocolumna xylanovorans]|uniref:Beta-1,4-mannooligosaccharide/beta-1,4-mannosyl-N-acetylglucosamine phosphorylase n=1 Tax=Anaerocolumna xylanovorans DSM 12503 TaxID=1121345 RepID=A0A1M7Y9N0_9FIRM|nr:DUF1861 family protein [Anaerocolumna xylanovorans]SHO49327.1 Protein of unknown function [Anaerocolumna xylanovorans DSM 12503]
MNQDQNIIPVSAKVLYENFKSQDSKICGTIHSFRDMGELDIYNPSVPFDLNGVTYIAGRVESREREHSKVMFFRKEETGWILCREAIVLELQDPFVTIIDNELILGGVRVDWDEATGCAKAWYTDFYRGTNLNNLTLFASGPRHMKDIRLVQLQDKRIGIFSRPQGQKMLEEYGCIAKIGFTVVDSLKDVTAKNIENAPFLEGLFLPDEWGGCNQIHLLKNGNLGVIGHIAYGENIGDEKYLHYYGMAFVLNPHTGERSTPKVIITRDCFPEGPAKAPRLKDITFTAGIQRRDDKKAVIYTGLSDAQIGSAVINDPFAIWENGMENLK